ncbi:cytochrome c oxidase accessory protein CcoG [Neptunicella marina]|uniref:Cytochrome c oxidase accessory protein CcoG n=1 Tax=Neptunicella marina TaxID=2125989 RepID=A0A8J6IWC9_9ALTE|nr:cytochrome c oxidase accessory protein CcoG [Neptunicella marina]MBC3767444.1 cytochrome c oxidase accessory protein CcoG [Neptunicella marina]
MVDPASIAEKDIIFRAPVTSGKIYIREQSGYFQRIRRGLNLLLVGLFVLLPLLQFNQRQAILFDVSQQHLRFFNVSLYPQDLMVFGLLFILGAFALFYVSKKYGRIWCGFACPQTVWTLMYNWIERRIEGSANQSRQLDKQPASGIKVLKKVSKHLIWGALSLLTALVFMSYFIEAPTLYSSFFTFTASPLIQGWVWFFAGCTYINAVWIREKMCQHICPYSRFQSVMFDSATTLVTYDKQRGENRGPRKRNSRPEQLGDCVDCGLCVQVCPVGIDIREGLQYECINCGLCIDACDNTMDKFNYAHGLIKFEQAAKSKSSLVASLGYALAMCLTLSAIGTWALWRHDFEVSIIRDRHTLYRINNHGQVENTYTIKILNKSQQSKTYHLSTARLDGAVIEGSSKITVAAESHGTATIALATQHTPQQRQSQFEFVITDTKTHDTQHKTNLFYAGEGAWN